tara:strand:+ start:7338 stop:8300 length:963 start_codon:yes stop_codon:yes gene_type:complete
VTIGAGPIGLISNPHSGHNREQFRATAERIARCPDIHHRVTNTPQDIDQALTELAAEHIGLLAINGGDGTGSAVLGRLLLGSAFPQPPLIALLPGGTANMNAGDVGVRGSLKKAVERFCRWCEGPRPTQGLLRERALMRVTPGDGIERFGMFLGAGAVIHGTEYAHREIHSRGLRDDFSLALGTLRTVWGVLRDDPQFNRHVRINMARDAQPARTFDTLILAVSTLERLSFGMRPFYGDGPGAIRLTLFEQGCTRFARTFTAIVSGRPGRHATPANGYHSHNAERLQLAIEGKINLDGELLDAGGTLAISASRPFRFLRL